ncbi:restriction endonuclease [Dietzia sp. MNB45]|uniref:restriction endonuclease n=1 Tax=Dietzia sp. MNB45 TaxID=3238800 RepID=UPI003F7F353A
MGLLDDWDLSYNDINELLTNNPSLVSFVKGYAAELKFRNLYLQNYPEISDFYKPDDHDRVEKGDWIVSYKGERIGIEVKSLQKNLVRKKADGTWKLPYQCDASDARPVQFDDGSSVHTTSLAVGEFDIVAVNLFDRYQSWRFAFCKNEDLTTLEGNNRGKAIDYTDYQKENLLRTGQVVPDPLAPPYTENLYALMDEVVEQRRKGIQISHVDKVAGEEVEER